MISPSDVNNTNGMPQPPENRREVLQPRPFPHHPIAPAVLSDAPNAVSLLKALRRRLLPALSIGLILAAAVGSAVWFFLPPPKLTARTQLHVAATPPNILFPENGNNNHEGYLRSQAYLIKDRFVINHALRLPGIAELSLVKAQPDPVQWLEKEIKVEFPSPEFMHITLSGDQSAELLKLVSAVTQSYLDNVVNKEHNARLSRLEDLKKILSRYEERTRSKKGTMRQLQESNGALNEKSMALLQQVALEDLHRVKTDLTQVRHDLRHLQVELGLRPDWLEMIWPRYAAALNSLPIAGLSINHAVVGLLHDEVLVAQADSSLHGAGGRELEELINQDKSIVENVKLIAALKSRIEVMRQHFREEAFEQHSLPLRNQLATLEKEVEKKREELRPLYIGKYRELVRRETQGSRQKLQEKYAAARELESLLLREAARLTEETKQIRKNAVDLGQIQEDIAKDEKVMLRAADKISSMEVEQEAPPRITQPDKEPILYTPDDAKRRMMFTAGASVAALALVLLAFSWFEFQSRKVHSPEEVVEGLGLHLVGTVPDHSPRSWLPWSRIGVGDEAYTQSLLTESVDAARTMLMHIAQKEKIQIVMITSALAGEGKTSLASHLAASLARAGRRTILVDSDLRRPTLHRLFDLSRGPGLSEVLREENDLAAVARDTAIPNLRLLSAGQADAVALQALAFDGLPKLFEQLRQEYEFIVVDSCPVLPVADSLLVGQHVDAVIFSLLRQVSRLPRVHAAYQRLAVLGIRMLGAVVNGTNSDHYPADYHYLNPEN